FENTTVDEISAAAGVARSTYYFHFADKDALLHHVATMSADRIGTAIPNIAQAPSIDEALIRYADVVHRLIERTPRDLGARTTSSVLGSIGYLGGDGNEDTIAGQLHRVFAAHVSELAVDVDTVELGAIAAAMVMEGLLRWSLHNLKQESVHDVVLGRLRLV